MSQSAPLEYAAAGQGRRRWAWWLAALALGLGATAAGRHWGSGLDRWQSLVRLRHAVLNATVAGYGPAVVVTPADTPDAWLNGLPAHAPDDRLWRRARARLVAPLARDPGPPVLLFMHERTAPSGGRRVVVAELSPIAFDDFAHLSLYVRLFEPGTVLHPAFHEVRVGPVVGLRIDGTIPGFPGVRCALAQLPWGHTFDLSPGRPDPTDASQFQFDYTLDGRPGRVIGRLGDDDGLAFRTADGSALPIAIGPPATTRPG